MRIRCIKPEFWGDKKVAQWDAFTRLLYIGLWSVADDYGCGSAEVAIIASSLFPFDLSKHPEATLRDVATSLNKLAQSGRISLYSVGDETYFVVLKWKDHQKVDRPSKSRIPRPEDGIEVPAGMPKPKPAEPAPKTDEPAAEDPLESGSKEILAYLNQRAGRSFEPTPTNLRFISARIIETKGDLDGIRAMIDRQCSNWIGTDMEEYLRPATLFNQTKFRAYYDDRNRPPSRRGGPPATHRTGDARNDGIAGLGDWSRDREARLSGSDPEAPPPGN